MNRFFVASEQVEGEQIRIVGKDVNHIRNVLRLGKGEKVEICCEENQTDYIASVEEMSEKEVCLHIEEKKTSSNELPSRIFLFQGLPKGDKMELIIQKTVELGVYAVIPVMTRRCIVKLDEKKAASRVKRWNAIAESAAKQAKRGIIPEVQMPVSYKEALRMAESCGCRVIPFEHAENMEETRRILSGIRPGEDIAIFIGPEGGFEDEEIELASEHGVLPVTLGKRILRTETAGMALVSVLMFALES